MSEYNNNSEYINGNMKRQHSYAVKQDSDNMRGQINKISAANINK